jgi:hypothetical protein
VRYLAESRRLDARRSSPTITAAAKRVPVLQSARCPAYHRKLRARKEHRRRDPTPGSLSHPTYTNASPIRSATLLDDRPIVKRSRSYSARLCGLRGRTNKADAVSSYESAGWARWPKADDAAMRGPARLAAKARGTSRHDAEHTKCVSQPARAFASDIGGSATDQRAGQHGASRLPRPRPNQESSHNGPVRTNAPPPLRAPCCR